MADFPVISICLNVLTSLALIALVGLGVYVNVNTILASQTTLDPPTTNNLYHVSQKDAASWNVGCAVIGTALGLLAATSLTSYDGYLTRLEISSDEGVNAIFLRPLTIRRGFQQVVKRQFATRRTALFLLTVLTVLTSTTVVAMFSIRAVSIDLVRSDASYPLALLDGCEFLASDEAGFGPPWTVDSNPFLSGTQPSQLSDLLYKVSYNAWLSLLLAGQPSFQYLPDRNVLDAVTYETFRTGGIGLNVTSYVEYSGTITTYSPPPRYEFNALRGTAFGTEIAVACRNVTSQYNVTSANVTWDGYPALSGTGLSVTKSGVNDLQFAAFNGDDYAAVGSALPLDLADSDPIHTLAIPYSSFEQALILECSYSGFDYLTNISLPSANSAIQIGPAVSRGSNISTTFQWTLLVTAHKLLTKGSRGGLLAQALFDVGIPLNTYLSVFPGDGEGGNTATGVSAKIENITSTIETVLGQLSEGYVSLLRQQYERSNYYPTCATNTTASVISLSLTIQRLGGGSYGWLSLPGLTLLGSLVAIIDICLHAPKHTERLDAQDTVHLLAAALSNPELGGRKARVRYDGSFTVVGRQGTSSAQVGRYSTVTKRGDVDVVPNARRTSSTTEDTSG